MELNTNNFFEMSQNWLILPKHVIFVKKHQKIVGFSVMLLFTTSGSTRPMDGNLVPLSDGNLEKISSKVSESRLIVLKFFPLLIE